MDSYNNNEFDLSGASDGLEKKVVFNGGQSEREVSNDIYSSKLTEFLINNSGGLLKDEEHAQYAILGLAVLVIIFSLFLFLGGGPEVSDQSFDKNRFVPGSSAL